MTAREYTDLTKHTLTSAGFKSDDILGRGETFFNNIRDSARGEVVNYLNMNFGSISPMFYQEIYVSKEDWEQEDDCVYKIPCPIPLYDSYGKPYINKISGSDWNCADSFRISRYRSEIRNANKHYILGRENLTRVFYDTNFKCLWLYRAGDISDISISQVCANPTDVPAYNVELDQYPFPTDQNDLLFSFILNRAGIVPAENPAGQFIPRTNKR